MDPTQSTPVSASNQSVRPVPMHRRLRRVMPGETPVAQPAIGKVRTRDLVRALKQVVLQCRSAETLLQQIVETIGQSETFVAVAWVSSSGDVQYLTNRLGTVLTEDLLRSEFQSGIRQAQSRGAGEVVKIPVAAIAGISQLAVRVVLDSSRTGTLCGLVSTGSGNEDPAAVLLLAAAYVDVWQGKTSLRELRLKLNQATSVIDWVGRVQSSSDPQAAAQTLVDALSQHLNDAHVSLGWVQRGDSIRLAAIAGVSSFETDSPLAAALAKLGMMALRRKSGVQTLEESRDVTATAELNKMLGTSCVETFALSTTTGRTVAVLYVASDAPDGLSSENRSLVRAASPALAAALHNLRMGRSGRWARLLRWWNAQPAIRRWIVVIVAAVVSLIMTAVPVSYRITAPCQLEPARRSYCVAPYDGVVTATKVEPGVTVQRGQILAEMDGRELRIELAEVQAQLVRAERESDLYKSQGDAAREMIADAERMRLASRRKLLQGRLEKMQIRSPVDGVILEGSLNPSDHRPVTRGEPLFEIAPTNDLRLEIEVPDESVAHVAPRQPVHLVFEGIGAVESDVSIVSIRPGSVIRQGENVFVALAELDHVDEHLRPGMRGRATIETAPHSLLWILGHRAWDQARLRLGW